MDDDTHDLANKVASHSISFMEKVIQNIIDHQ